MSSARIPWRRLAVLAVGVVVVLWAADRWGVPKVITVIGLLGFSGVSVLEWLRSGAAAADGRGPAVGAAALDEAAQDLLRAVRRTWQQEAAHRGLTSPLPVAVPFRLADPRLAAHPDQWSAGNSTTVRGPGHVTRQLGSTSDMGALYADVSSGRLVILGEPGSGKTAAAVLLLLALVEGGGSGERVPALLPLSSWDPTSRTIREWLADGLVVTYRTQRHVAEALLEDDRVLPVLDGFDELPRDHHEAAMQGLRSLGASPFVLTSRTAQYAAVAADAVLERAAVLQVVPVRPEDAATYLVTSGSADTRRWEPVVAVLRHQGPHPLKAALGSPLLLSLARTVYRRPASRPSELLSAAAPRDVAVRLLDGLLPAVYGKDAQDVPVATAQRWLGCVAERWGAGGSTTISWWRLPETVPQWQLRVCGALVGGGVALLAGLVLAVLALLGADSSLAVVTWVVLALALTARGALVKTDRPAPAQWRRPRWSTLVIAIAATVFAVVALLVFVAEARATVLEATYDEIGVTDAFGVLLTGSLTALLFTATVLAVLRGFSRVQSDAVTPSESWSSDLTAGLAAGATVAAGTLAFFTTVFVIADSVFSGADAPLSAATIGAAVGVLPSAAAFLWSAPRRCSSAAYGLAVLLLWAKGQLPARPLRFLDEAYQRGVLRRSGPTFEFKHALLAERLAAQARTAARPDEPTVASAGTSGG